MSCVVGQRHGSDLALLWLWCRLVATAPTGPLAWEPPYAAGVALERQNKTKNIYIIYIYIYSQNLENIVSGHKKKAHL